MRDWKGKRYWVVGASEGLGREVARKMGEAGAHLILSARSEDRLIELDRELGGGHEVVTVDVSDDEDVKEAAAKAGDIDGLVYLAGVYWPQSAQEWDAGQVTKMFDINLTGCARVLGQVVPPMVARDRGHVVLTGSLTAFRGLPESIGYTASKAGILALAESMYADLRKTGVHVQIVNPGFIRTRLTDKNDFKMPMIMEPEAAAREYMDHISGDNFSKSFPRSMGALLRSGNLLPESIYFRLVGGG